MTRKIDIARIINTRPDGSVIDHVVFEGGTVIGMKREIDDAKIREVTRAISDRIGPHGGEGGPQGDFNPMQLKAFDGWLVEFCWGASILTIVLPEDIKTAPAASSTEVVRGVASLEMNRALEMIRAGLAGRALRDRDMRECVVVTKSWVTTG
jgi:hypothetical protein